MRAYEHVSKPVSYQLMTGPVLWNGRDSPVMWQIGRVQYVYSEENNVLSYYLQAISFTSVAKATQWRNKYPKSVMGEYGESCDACQLAVTIIKSSDTLTVKLTDNALHFSSCEFQHLLMQIQSQLNFIVTTQPVPSPRTDIVHFRKVAMMT